jgi:hypothetical protein
VLALGVSGCRDRVAGATGAAAEVVAAGPGAVAAAAPGPAKTAGGPAGGSKAAVGVAAERPVVLVAVGDVAGRGNRHAATAALAQSLYRQHPLDGVLILGDVVYPRGELHDFYAYYEPTWGQPPLRAVTYPVPGNHEYDQGRSDASGYFDYFNGTNQWSGRAGERDKGYYSFDLGAWHIVALNSSDGCRRVSCAVGSPMHRWLVADLAATKQRCVLAYWHHPRFQTGATHGSNAALAPLWNALYDAGAELVLSGHDHNFQQLARLDKEGRRDPTRGIRSFVVGTGGAGAYPAFDDTEHGQASEARFARRVGVLLLHLTQVDFRWQFVATTPAGPGEVLSEGRDVCR